MSSVNRKTISLSVLSTTAAINAGHVITSGDSSAYTLEVTFTDVTTISGTCQLHFVLGDGTYADRDDSDGVTIAGNKVSYLLPEAVYSVSGLVCYVQFIDSNLYTPLKIAFSGIRALPGGVPTESLVSYPAWVTSVASAEALRVIAENARVVAENARLANEGDAGSGRVKAEADRIIAEGLRVTADGSRTTAEGLRVTAEGNRVTAENNRVSAENSRVTAESRRAAWHASYDAGHDYLVGEKVSYNGSSYICILDSTGNLPTNGTYWTLIASKGDQGDAGTITVNSTNTAMTGLIAGDGSKVQNPTATQVGNLPMSDPGNYFPGDDKLLTQMQAAGAQLAQIASQIIEKTSYGVYTGLGVTRQAAPDMTVAVSTGTIYMSNGARWTPAAVAALAVTAADATNPRIDIVYVDKFGVISYLAGTAAATPAEPAVPTGGQLIATILVTANKTSILTADISNRRKSMFKEAYITPTLLNSWVNYLNDEIFTPRYYKNAEGVVRIRGCVKDGTSGPVIFNLPAGYRPGRVIYVTSWGGVQWYITASGAVQHASGATNLVDIDISFFAEA